MKDFSCWEEYEGTSEGSGRSEKIWLKNPDSGLVGLFKYKKDINTTDHISECIAYHIAELLEIPCAKFELGTFLGREGSISYNIIQNENEILIEGINFLSYLYPQYDPDNLRDMESGDVYSIEMIEKVMSKFLEFKSFLTIPVFDYLIGNSDRHQSNWAVLIKQGHSDFSPLYDNSSSLCAYLTDEQSEAYLGKDKLRFKSLVETKSKSLIRRTLKEEKRPTHLEMLEYIKNHYYYETKGIAEKTAALLTEERICDILYQYQESGLSETKIVLIKSYLMAKIQNLQKLYS